MCNSNIGGFQSCTADRSDPAIVVSAAVLEDAFAKTPFENGGPTQQRSAGGVLALLKATRRLAGFLFLASYPDLR